ncbi:MAG: hypothetical protein HC925_09725 [Coleofasciculaceae cyanobacterium SM2_3_26]|nr:hypothetical protein [Coleofasciculaceae cyanobacterium SM2_3_26]
MNEDRQALLQIYLQEYTSLKAEQTQRIGFRDNLLYVTLGAFGGILSFAVSNPANYFALLVLPWICLILGWTYLVMMKKSLPLAAICDRIWQTSYGNVPVATIPDPRPLQGVPDRPDVRPILAWNPVAGECAPAAKFNS